MKKFLSVIALILVMTMMVSTFASCGIIEKITEAIENIEIPDDDPDNPDNPDKPDNPDNPDNPDEPAEPTVTEKLAEFGKKTGYEITMNTNSDGYESTVVLGRKGNAFWVITDGSGSAFVSTADTEYVLYSFNGEEWESGMKMPTTNFEDTIDIYQSIYAGMLFYATPDSSYDNQGSATIAGRPCHKYKYEQSSLGASASILTWIDDELGLTLKWEYDISVTDSSGSTSMEVSSFKTGSDVILPAFPEPSEDYVDYTGAQGWPDNSYTQLIPQAPGTVLVSMIANGQFAAQTSGVTEDDYKAYIDAAKAMGFDMAEEGYSAAGLDSNGNELAVEFDIEGGQMMVALSKVAAE